GGSHLRRFQIPDQRTLTSRIFETLSPAIGASTSTRWSIGRGFHSIALRSPIGIKVTAQSGPSSLESPRQKIGLCSSSLESGGPSAETVGRKQILTFAMIGLCFRF